MSVAHVLKHNVPVIGGVKTLFHNAMLFCSLIIFYRGRKSNRFCESSQMQNAVILAAHVNILHRKLQVCAFAKLNYFLQVVNFLAGNAHYVFHYLRLHFQARVFY